MRARLLFPLALLAACAPPEVHPPSPDASATACTTRLCGARCCEAGEVCFAEACCAPTSCTGRQCGDDGCGTSCGTCGTGSRCDPGSWTCVACTAETAREFCARQAGAGKVCGAIAGTDACTGASRLEDCGGCVNGKGCAADHTCTAPLAETREQFCARHGADCGSVTDSSASPARTENCGQCPPEQDCLGNVCTGCTPEDRDGFCARQATSGKVCGVITAMDSCGAARTEDCGAARCLEAESCDPATNACRPCPQETDAELCAQAGRDCGDYVTTDACGRSRSLSCGPCPAGFECRDNVCSTPGAPGNNRCLAVGAGTAWDLTPAFVVNGSVVEGTATITGSTAAASDDSAGTCESGYAPQDGGDVIYRLTLPPGAGEHLLRATVDRAQGDTDFFPAVYLRTICDDPTTESACGSYGSGGIAEAVLPQAGPGTVFVIVDGEDGSRGGFSLTLTLGPAVRVPGCPGDPLVFDATGRATATSDTSLAQDRTTTGCGDSGGGDVAYQFTVPAGRRVNLSASATPAPGSSLLPALALRSVCSQAASERACALAPDVGEPASIAAQGLGPGTYHLVVDSPAGDEGAFTLAATLVDSPPAPANDTCATPEDLGTLDGTSVSRALDTSGATDDSQAGCGAEPMTGGDVVFRFTLAARASVLARVLPDPQTPGFAPAVYLLAQCPSAVGDELRCGAAPGPGAEAQAFARDLPPGTYFAVVDGLGGSFGKAQLTLAAGAPVILPDGCATVQPIPLAGLDASGNGTLTVAGDTTDAVDDQRSLGRCGTGGGADLVYSLTLAATKDVAVSLAYDDPYSDPVVYLRRGACDTLDPLDELGCADYQTGPSFQVLRLAPGTYHLWADAYSGAAGSFTLQVQLTDPTPAPGNDTCLGTVPELTFQGGHATLAGDSTAASHDRPAGCTLADGPDLVYRVEVPAGAPQSLSVTVDAAPGSDLSPVVSLHSSCADPTGLGELACGTAVWGGATATASSLAPGSYWVWVGGSKGSAGAFDLDATLGPPLAGPGNDACPSAQTVVIDPATGIGTATGSTSGANDDSASVGCGSGDEDVVFAFSLAAPQKVVLTVTPDAASADFEPVLALRRECGVFSAASEVACGAAAGPGDPASITAWSLPAGQYFAWVDSLFEAGGFSLEVRLEPPVASPANDTCRGAEALALPAMVQASTTTAGADYGSTLSATCHSAAWGDAPGREVVYAYTPAADGDFTVVVTPTGGWDALLWYTAGSCGSASACADASDLGFDDQAEELTIAGVAGVTYFFYVDAYDNVEGGAFTLSLY